MTPAALNTRITQMATPPVAAVYAWAGNYDGSCGPLLDFSQAAPGYPPHADLLVALGKSASDTAHSSYGQIQGESRLRQVYAKHLSETYGAALTPENIQVSSGCNQAFVASLMTVAGAGDAALLIAPFFFNHRDAMLMLGIRPDVVETDEADGFMPRVDAITAAITPETRAVVLVTPNNPTGGVYSQSLIADVFEVCREHGLWLLIDETYRDFPDYGGEAPHALFSVPDWESNLIQVYSFSKAYCIPGHRLGAVTAGPAIIEQTTKVIDNLQICAPQPPQAAIADNIEVLAPWRAENRIEIATRAQAMQAVIDILPGWTIVSIGTYFAYVRHPYTDKTSEAAARMLAEDAGVITIPGGFFGDDQAAYIRIAFANAGVEKIKLLGERLKSFVPT